MRFSAVVLITMMLFSEILSAGLTFSRNKPRTSVHNRAGENTDITNPFRRSPEIVTPKNQASAAEEPSSEAKKSKPKNETNQSDENQKIHIYTERTPSHLKNQATEFKLSVMAVLEDLVGSGSFARVLFLNIPTRAKIEKIQHNGHTFAIKSSLSEQHQREMTIEYHSLESMRSLEHPNVITLLGATGSFSDNKFTPEMMLFTFYPFDLKTYNVFQWLTPAEIESDIDDDMKLQMQAVGPVDFSIPTVLRLMLHLLRGIAYLHQNLYGHSDIKPDNCLIRKTSDSPCDLFLVIGDLAYCTPLHDKIKNCSDAYTPPEYFKQGNCSVVNYDRWALAITMGNCLTLPCYHYFDGYLPDYYSKQTSYPCFQECCHSFAVSLQRYLQKEHAQFMTSIPESIEEMPSRNDTLETSLDCVYLLLATDPDKRPPVEAVLKCIEASSERAFPNL